MVFNPRLTVRCGSPHELASFTLPRAVELRNIGAFHEDCRVSISYSVWTRLVKSGFFARPNRVAIVEDSASFLLILAGRQRTWWICSHDSEPPLPYLSRFNIIKVKPLSHVSLFVTTWTVACQALLSMRFSRQEYWSGLPFPSSGDLPNTGIKPGSPALQADSLRLNHQGRLIYNHQGRSI